MRILILILLFLVAGCISDKAPDDTDSDTPALVLENGDFVKMDFTGWINETGEMFDTTHAKVAFDPAIEKMDRFTLNSQYDPIDFTLGKGQILPALEAGMIGMKIGEEKNITLAPEDGYGEWYPEYTMTTARVAVMPILINVSLSDFRMNIGKEPEINESVQLNYWTANVVNVSNTTVTLLNEPEDGTTIDTQYGPAAVTLNDTHITTDLDPESGTVITTLFGEGVISDVNDTDFTVDFNHPLAGMTLVFEVTVSDIVKAEQMLAQKIVWTDYETGIEMAKSEKRPAVIALYLGECQACEALDAITFSNPAVTELKDEFVWIKVDVSANPQVGNEYDTKSYPTVVLLNRGADGSKKITGYITPADLRKELDALV